MLLHELFDVVDFDVVYEGFKKHCDKPRLDKDKFIERITKSLHLVENGIDEEIQVDYEGNSTKARNFSIIIESSLDDLSGVYELNPVIYDEYDIEVEDFGVGSAFISLEAILSMEARIPYFISKEEYIAIVIDEVF